MKKGYKTAKGSEPFKIAGLIEYAIKYKQRVWYSEFYNEWLTQKYSTRHNYTEVLDFTIDTNSNNPLGGNVSPRHNLKG